MDLNQIVDSISERIAARLEPLFKQPAKIQPRLLTVEAAGEYLSRTPASIRHLIKDGKLPVCRMDNRIFLDVRELDRLIDGSRAFMN